MIECLPSGVAMANVPKVELRSAAATIVHTDSNALHKAVRLGKLRLTRLLVEGGTDIHSIDEDGRSALIIACMMKYDDDGQKATRFKMVKFLLEHGAKVDVQDKHGRTCLMYACLERTGPDVVKLLLKHDADPRITDKNGSSALVHAVNARNSSVLSILVEACKNKGKEVIIITTNERGKERDTKQYLNVPPSLAQSPPFYQCISPSQVDWSSPETIDVPALKGQTPKVHLQRDKQSIDSLHRTDTSPRSHDTLSRSHDNSLRSPDTSPRSPDASPRSPVTSPRSHQRLQLALQPPPLQNRRLVRRSSMGLLYDTGSTSPSRSHPDLPEETEEETIKANDGHAPVPHTSTWSSSESLHRSPRTYRRPLIRRQSADAFNPSLLKATNSRMHHSTYNSANSTPEKKAVNRGVSNRRCSLPMMPPPLKRSQTIHAINVAKSILEMNKSTDSNYESDANSSSDIATDQRVLGSGNNINQDRRGSVPFLLEDELSYKRPGTLPPLNINPRPPIPDIGSTTFKSSPRQLRHVDIDLQKRMEASQDRRFSIQVEDIRRLTGGYRAMPDVPMHESHPDFSGDSGAESS